MICGEETCFEGLIFSGFLRLDLGHPIAKTIVQIDYAHCPAMTKSVCFQSILCFKNSMLCRSAKSINSIGGVRTVTRDGVESDQCRQQENAPSWHFG
jgi:hypothetical protein